MQPIGDKILVKDITEGVKLKEGLMKEGASGILTVAKETLQKVEVVSVSAESTLKLYDEKGKVTGIKVGDICLSSPGGVEMEDGTWLRNENLLWAKL